MQNALMALVKPSHANQFGAAGSPRHPDDSDECVFLLRACDRIGAAIHGDQWTGYERTTQLPDLLPDAFDPAFARAQLMSEPDDGDRVPAQWFTPPSRAVLVRANALLARRRPDRQRFTMGSGLLGMMSPIPFTYSEWKEAQAEAQAESDAARASILRWVDVQRFVKQHCEQGRLATHLRGVGGGEYSSGLPRSWWRTEDYFMRFVTFKMHPVHPFMTDLPASEYQWIFVDAASLERLLVKLRRAAGTLDDTTGVFESEYMQCMRDVSAALKITADNMPKKAVVEVEIPNHWRGKDPLSPSDIKHMASLIRSEASRGGRKPR